MRKRYFTEGQILKKIDSALDRMKKYTLEMEQAQEEVKRLSVESTKDTAPFDLKTDLKVQKNRIKFTQARVKRIAKDLPRLAAKLATFRTDTLPFAEEKLRRHDISV